MLKIMSKMILNELFNKDCYNIKRESILNV